jgi:hypothetical protein
MFYEAMVADGTSKKRALLFYTAAFFLVRDGASELSSNVWTTSTLTSWKRPSTRSSEGSSL